MIIGLDLSLTATGFFELQAGVDGHHGPCTITPPKPLSDEARLDWIVDRVTGTARGGEIDLVVIESPSFGSMGKNDQLWALNWMVRCALRRARIPVLMVAPSQVKKFATGSGAAEKSLVLMNVLKRWGVECADDNQADALVIAKIGAAFLGLEECDTAAQREVIAVLKTPKVKAAKRK